MKEITETLLNRLPIKFVREVCTITETGCWEWPFKRDRQGYAIHAGVLVHRIMCTQGHGSSNGMFALHSCDNPPCVNPGHLRWGTQAENMADRDARRRIVGG